MIRKNKKIIFIGSGILVAVLALIFLLYQPIIFQEGNPWPLVEGIIRLNFTQDKIARLDMAGEKYLTKDKNGRESLAGLLNGQGYEFFDQLGAGYVFKDKDGDTLVATHRYYSHFYSI